MRYRDFVNRICSLNSTSFVLVVVLTSVLVSLFFFSPRWNYWDLSKNGAFEVDRANIFLDLLRDPYAEAGDKVLQWRRLIPLIGYTLGLSDSFFLTLPFLGCIALLAYVCIRLKELSSPLIALFGTLLFSTFSSHLVSFHWWGIFDSYFILYKRRF